MRMNKDSLENHRQLERSVHALTWGTHLTNIYRSKEEKLAVVVAYLEIGLKRNERCLHIDCYQNQVEICQRLADFKINVKECLDSGRLVFLSKEQSYLQDNYFSPARMMQMISEAHYETLKAGFYGLRGSGDLSWISQNYPGVKGVIDYEHELNLFLRRSRLMAFCHYNEEEVPEDFLASALCTHPKAFIYGRLYDNPYYINSDTFAQMLSEERPVGDYEQLRDNIIQKKKEFPG